MKTHLIDFHVHTIYSQEQNANLSIKDTLDYYQKLGDKADGRIIVRINDHDNFYGGVDAVEYFLAHRNDYPNVFVVPGVEFNVNLGPVLEFEDPNYKPNDKYPDSDEKYIRVFKKAHIGAAPILKDIESFKKWKNNKDLQVYSKLSKMLISKSTPDSKFYFEKCLVNLSNDEKNDYYNTGEFIITLKNIVRKKYGVIIPFSKFEDCVQDGITHNEAIDKFYDIAAQYLKTNYSHFSELSLNEIKEKIFVKPIFRSSEGKVESALRRLEKRFDCILHIDDFNNCYTRKNINEDKFYETALEAILKLENKEVKECKDVLKTIKDLSQPCFVDDERYFVESSGNRRINFDELCQIVTEAGGIIDFEHPNVNFIVHKNRQIPVKLLKDLDYSVLNNTDREKAYKLLSERQTVALEELLGDECKNDDTGLVRLQLIRKSIKDKIKLNNDLIGVEIPQKWFGKPYILEKMLTVMENNHFVPTTGTDKHLNTYDRYKIYIQKFLDARDRTSIIVSEFTEEFFKKLAKKLNLSQEKRYEDYYEKTYDAYQYNSEQKKSINIKTLYNRMTQSAFCDAVFGKEIDFENSSMITIEDGGLANPIYDKYSCMMLLFYQGINACVQLYGKENIPQDDLEKIKQKTRNVMLKIREKNAFEANDGKCLKFLDKYLEKNNKEIKQLVQQHCQQCEN